jgi:hypothetical protein
MKNIESPMIKVKVNQHRKKIIMPFCIFKKANKKVNSCLKTINRIEKILILE